MKKPLGTGVLWLLLLELLKQWRAFISNTNWTEAIGLKAALTTIKKMSKTDVTSHIEKIGLQVKDFLGKYGNKYNFALKIE